MANKYLYIFFAVIFWLPVSGQYFQTGEDPASLKWRQINTPHFRLIYPEEFEAKAHKMASILDGVYDFGSYSLNHTPRKIPVIFHTRTVSSNGLLAWAPRRVEMYTTPHQSIYPQDWLEQLAIHEFRHVVQVDKISQSLPGIIPFFLAQQGAAIVTGAYLPFWFLEGDAVSTETALSKSGRGRNPSFLMETQAQMVKKGKYSFEKAYMGSYKDFVPNHYRMGYFLVGGARNLFGEGLWENVVSNVGEKPFSLTPFNTSLKAQAGLNQRQLYSHVFDSLRSDWLKEDNEYDEWPGRAVSRNSETYTNYKYNFYTEDGSLLTLKNSFKEIPKFKLISSYGSEETLVTPGTIFYESIGLGGNLLTWSEQVPDIRWEHSGKSLIHIYDIKSKTDRSLKPECKGFSPAISPDKQKLALAEVDFSNNYYLSVYDIRSGELLTRYQTAENNYIFTPEWINNNQLVAVLLTAEGKVLASVNPFEKTVEFLADESMGDVRNPVVHGNDVYFISSYSGKNELFTLNLKDKDVSRVYSPRFGADYPAVSPDGNRILLSDYTAGGFRLIEIDSIKHRRQPVEELMPGSYELAEILSSQEKGIPDFSGPDTEKYTSEKYKKAAHLFNFHSWAPVYVDVNSYDIQPGVSVMSQNELGTAVTSLGYKWDVSEKTGRIYGNFTYRGWFPVINAEISYGKRASDYLSIINYTNDKNEIVRSDTSKIRFTWNETTVGLAGYIPLNFTRGKYYRLLQPEIKYELTSRRNPYRQPDWFTSGNINSLSYRLYFHQIMKKAAQDLVPDFGIVADISYRHSPGGNLNLGNLASVQLINYLPGFHSNHGLVVYNGFQKRETGSGQTFSDAIRYPRGYGKLLNNEMYSFSADYKMPLFYPDLSLGKLLYLKRVKTSLFADFSYQEGNIYNNGDVNGSFSQNISSYGLELTGNMHFLRFYAPVEMGFRAAYLPEAARMHYGFLFSIDFTSF